MITLSLINLTVPLKVLGVYPMQTLAASSLDLSSADSAYASSPSSESDAPPRQKEKRHRKTKITEIKEQEEVKDSLDEDANFSERLI